MDKLDLVNIINKYINHEKINFDIGMCCLLLIANRCIDPQSKLSVDIWQKKVYIDKYGVPDFKYH